MILWLANNDPSGFMELNVTLSERLEGLMLEARRAKTRTVRKGGGVQKGTANPPHQASDLGERCI